MEDGLHSSHIRRLNFTAIQIPESLPAKGMPLHKAYCLFSNGTQFASSQL
jgi:hypothetical protein